MLLTSVLYPLPPTYSPLPLYLTTLEKGQRHIRLALDGKKTKNKNKTQNKKQEKKKKRNKTRIWPYSTKPAAYTNSQIFKSQKRKDHS